MTSVLDRVSVMLKHHEVGHNTFAVAVNGKGIVIDCLWEIDNAMTITIKYVPIIAIIMLL